jgi:hypothetical protein
MSSNFSAKAGSIATAVALAAVLWSGPSRATTFTFGDEYWVSSSAGFTAAFGTVNTGSYSTAGIYQKTNTTPGAVTVTQLSSHATGSQSVPGEFVQNTTPNASVGLLLNGWNENLHTTPDQQLNNGTNSVFQGPNNYLTACDGCGFPYDISSTSTALNFQYLTGVTSPSLSNGTVTAFNLTSIELDSTGSDGFTLEGLVGRPTGTVVDTMSVSNNGQHSYTLNWTGVDTVAFVGLAGQGSLTLQNVNLTPVPAPLIGHGLPAVLAFGGLLFGARFLQRRAASESMA